jgi:hypothetical protein
LGNQARLDATGCTDETGVVSCVAEFFGDGKGRDYVASGAATRENDLHVSPFVA